MALYFCSDCLEGDGQQLTDTVSLSGVLPFSRRVSPLRACLGGLIGGLVVMLAGNPVAVLVGAAAGVLASGLELPGLNAVGRTSDSAWGTCAICGSSEDLESCGSCGRPVCASHRQLVMGQEEHEGRPVYRHYIREEKADEDASLSLMPSLAGDESDEESPQTAYRLGDEVYVLNEETGELMPLAEDSEQQDGDTGDVDVGDWENPAESDGWGDFDGWGSADWESGDWESADTDGEEGGE